MKLIVTLNAYFREPSWPITHCLPWNTKSLSPAYVPPPLPRTGDLIIIEHIITPSPQHKKNTDSERMDVSKNSLKEPH